MLRVPGAIEFIVEHRQDLCVEIVDTIEQLCERTHGSVRQTTEHIEFVDRAWLEPLQRTVRLAPIALTLTLPLLRPIDAVAPSPTAIAARLASARLLCRPEFASLLRHALDGAQRVASRHAEPTSYVSLAGAALTANVATFDFSHAAVLRGMRRQYPAMAISETTELDALLHDERGYRWCVARCAGVAGR